MIIGFHWLSDKDDKHIDFHIRNMFDCCPSWCGSLEEMWRLCFVAQEQKHVSTPSAIWTHPAQVCAFAAVASHLEGWLTTKQVLMRRNTYLGHGPFFSPCLQVVVPNRGLHLSKFRWSRLSHLHSGLNMLFSPWFPTTSPQCRRVKVTKMKLDLNGRCKLYLQSSAPRRWKIRGRHGIIYGKGVGNYSKTVVNLL